GTVPLPALFSIDTNSNKAPVMRFTALLAAAIVVAAGPIRADEPRELMSSELAVAFGTAPVMWGLRLSPDGTKLSGIQMHPSGTTVAIVVDLAQGSSVAVLAGRKDEFDIRGCDWANHERLLCGLRGLLRTQR